MRTVLLAGATGVLGRHVARELTARGYRVRRLVRENANGGDWLGDLRWPPSLKGALAGVDAVVSCAGASMRLDNWRDRFTFHEVDWLGNRNLLEAAARTGVRKFVYVSLAHGRGLLKTQYAAAHERFVDSLANSGLAYSVVRPTGLYSFFGEVLKMASQGRGIVIGDGAAQTNPIHEADAARACADALSSDQIDVPVGGPAIYSRKDIVSLAFRSLGKPESVRSVPAWAMTPVPLMMKLLNPRIAALVEFGIAVSQMDVVAPRVGRATLEDYFSELAGRQYGRWPSRPQDSVSSATSKRTMTGTGSSPERNSTNSYSAHR